MHLIMTVVAAVVFIILRFAMPKDAEKYQFGVGALIFAGATVMWCVDGFMSLSKGGPFVEFGRGPQMFADLTMGLIVLIIGVGVWGIFAFHSARNSD
ncbi:MAG: hypothetical protein LBK04_01270 [Clostridiales Family XIII bacterium]|jgi:hypothetical protein|nr:hypothetical protein [Clostridiales Family XIII bacterium]